MPKQIAIEVTDFDSLEPDLRELLRTGNTFVRGAEGVCAGDVYEIVIVRVADGSRMRLPGMALLVVAGGDPGVGFEITDFTEETRQQIEEFVAEARPNPEEEGEGDARTDHDHSPQKLHARLRGLNSAEQFKVARDGDVNERTVLERLYGKSVWEALLRNPRLSHSEVARIARMGALPKPQLEQIIANRAWISSPQVRRALLTNRRLSSDMVNKIIRVAPKAELRLMPKQTAYPPPVREAARKLLKQMGVG